MEKGVLTKFNKRDYKNHKKTIIKVLVDPKEKIIVNIKAHTL